MDFSGDILERFRVAHGKDIDLGLRAPYLDLLAAMGSPEKHLPPALVVGGTNGKGSTCAFLRAMIEATGRSVHVFTSPHLVAFYERIRIAGKLIGESELASILTEIEGKAEKGGVSLFEAITAAALTAFARHKADATLLEVGLGGRLDSTNVLPAPLGTVISRLSFDHRAFLGESMAQIAYEKAGIMRKDVPCFIAPQPSREALTSLKEQAAEKGAPLAIGGKDWRIEEDPAGRSFRYISKERSVEGLPLPALIGKHQLWNAGLAIAASSALPFPVPDEAIRKAMTTVTWAGRLQRLTGGKLLPLLLTGSELWLDGGHNDSAGEVLAAQMDQWLTDDKPLDLIYGMLTTKVPEEFLTPILPYVRRIRTVRIDGETAGFSAESLAARVAAMGARDVHPCESLHEALRSLAHAAKYDNSMPRCLITGSLYLVGQALKENG